jgi:cyclic pyranopterin phosphate synthase
MPPDGVKMMKHSEILSFEEISSIIETLVPIGINKIRFTGGEPLVRSGIEDLIGMVSKITGVNDISLTTNGILLKELAQSLVSNGLTRVNVSLDTIDPVQYKALTRGGDIRQVFKGIEAARAAGLDPIKINCVRTDQTSEKDLNDLRLFCQEQKLALRFIRQMSLSSGSFSQVEGGDGGNCEICNRIRLTANGYFKPCLFSDFEFSVRELGIVNAYRLALEHKPQKGMMNTRNEFYNIGG